MHLIRAVILDWAGTTVDLGSVAPVRAMQRVLEGRGISVPDDVVRRDMGLAKRDHLARLLSRVDPTGDEALLDSLYDEFATVQLDVLRAHSDVIAGVPETVARMRERGIRIGSTTGYTRPMLDIVAERAREQGYAPDCSVVPEDAGSGRPAPFMMFVAAMRLDRYPLSRFVKVGDTTADVAEGLNAGTWTVGVSKTGNSDASTLTQAGAHFVVDSVANLDPILDAIDERLGAGQRP